jgi:hypothetical protein
MAIIFNSVNDFDNRGRVVMLPNVAAAPGALVQVEGWAGFTGFKAILTQVNLQFSTNHQFQQMLGGGIYLDVFGDRIGMLQLGGLAFLGACDNDQRTGFSYVENFYRENRLSNRATPLRVTTDPFTVYEGYLFGFQGSSVSIGSLDQRTYQFTMSIAVPP